ncbi:VCBS repeat-containing protein [Acetivibrio straminisolvens]|jgi:tetratricopeptide (TPR) repeat protein|uniref:Tetratricopeptide repeat protein n=1 Tax=Acetivibrio straminisolvens JCM 21531 TaxID=1294263 RepID=W4V6A9_9FIRM|nr:VCBS repeat-containing protein [Acetivibrio straminisolvens]GAE88726.1 hypothetical protein JCM21531_2194 [Acetivibrio straminisolvens JCM 21531]
MGGIHTTAKLILIGIVFLFAAAIMISTTGCDILPPPASAIKPPQYANMTSGEVENSKAIARRFLAPGTQFSYPVNPKNADAVWEIDIDGDGRTELLALYRGRDLKNNGVEVFGVFILKQDKNREWQIFWQQQYTASIVTLDWADVRDITGDNYPELLIGWNMGYRLGSNLDIYSLKEEVEPKLISSIKYSEIVGIEDRRGVNNEIKPVLMMYLFDEEMYESESEGRRDEYFCILQWDHKEWMEGGLVEADDFYSSYYVGIIEDLKKSLERYRNDYYRWYVLAIAQLRSGKPLEALKSIDTALEITQRYIDRHGAKTIKEVHKYQKKAKILKAQAYIKIGKYYESIIESNFALENYSVDIDELLQIYLNLGYAYTGLKQYGTASMYFNKSCQMAEAAYKEGTALYLLYSYKAKKELEYIKPFLTSSG